MTSRLVVIGILVPIALYALLVLLLLASGRRTSARGLAGFIPDCLVLFRRLAADRRVPRRRKLVLVLVVGYLAFPIDLIPDFLPLIGVLDDALVVGLALRYLTRGGGESLIREHWPGPEASLELVIRLAFGRKALPRQP